MGAAPVGGRASVARAAVRPVSPAVGGGGGLGPNDPGSNGRRGLGGGGKNVTKAAKKRRRANILTAAAAVLVILAGGGVVAGTWFFDGVDLPAPKTEDQSNVILNAKGQVLAKLGTQNRTVVPQASINPYVQHAVAAAEDKNFYTHSGIDMKGIMRAAWNNFTGGDKQGASTITQQYARYAADLKAISYNRKLREAVIARKLESTYDKDQIMGFYLNYIYLGEGRYGIEAAAQGYFSKSVMTPEGQKNAITPSEAAVLASIIKQPEPDPNGGHKGYDPNYNLGAAKERWEYTMSNMLEMKWITKEQYDARKYPTVNKPNANKCKTCAGDSKPVGMIMRHVKAELAEMNISETEFTRGGLTVQTTIDPEVQAAAEAAGSRKSKTSAMHDLPKSYQAAVIGIDPSTGRVLGYYGGDDPTGIDYGSYMNGDGTGFSGTGQSPGSTFKIYTLAAAQREDISFKTTWDGTKKKPDGGTISNAGADPGKVCGGKIKYCDLETATIQSYNFPFYQIAEGIGREKVLEAARDAGITHVWTDKGEMVDLTKTDAAYWKANGRFDNEIGFGQYHVVPLEHAQGVATIVNNGVRHEAHFIKTVKRIDQNTGKLVPYKSEKTAGKTVFDKDRTSDLQGVMAKIPDHANNTLRNGREAIAKSGTWEFDDGKDNHSGSGDTWFVGGIPQLAATVWVGGATKKVELHEADGKSDMFGSGTPAQIWEDFINAVTKAEDMKKEEFPTRVETGNADSEYATGQEPPPPPVVVQPPTVDPNSQLCQLFPQQCQNTGNGNNNNGNGDNNNDNNNGGGGNNNGGGNTTLPGATTPGTAETTTNNENG
ncbi:transglycosylase domain-containing protein [Winogradskya consettensis]|uniref:transglycosylase domain-containing protein n=1 Tax=Winogradskya consettensis TaxID=113560 RepID=UPI001FD3B84A|nr:transglycosylase domain-containing protein [Actinoplanes consettensis]